MFPTYGIFIDYQKDITDIYSIDAINGAAYGFLGLKFESLSDMYQQLQNIFNLDLSTTISCDNATALPLNANGAIIKQVKTPKVIAAQNAVIKRNNADKYWRVVNQVALTSKKKSGRSVTDLALTMQNPRITGSNARYLEFDIYGQSNSGQDYLSNLAIRMQYNASVFGDSIFSRGNAKLTIGNYFTSPTYGALDSNAYDIDNQSIAFVIGTDFGVTNITRVKVPVAPTLIAHLRFKIQNCHQYSGIYFIDTAIAAFVSNYTASIDSAFPRVYSFNSVSYNGSLNDKMCEPRIDGFTSTLRAGVGDTLAINGAYFGNNRDKGQVYISNVDDGGLSYLPAQDSIDYLSWSDNEIKLLLTSSNVAGSKLINKKTACLGSGPIWVRSSSGDSTQSTTSIDVSYAITNQLEFTDITNTIAKGKYRNQIANLNGAGMPSRIFHCDTSISKYYVKKRIVELAIHDWNCRTGVNWELGSDTTAKGQFDFLSVISINQNLNGLTGSTSYKDSRKCSTANSTEYLFAEEDIELADDLSHNLSGVNWSYDTTGGQKPAGVYSFYNTILHELGHAHSIAHNSDKSDLMYWQAPLALVPASNGPLSYSLWVKAYDAGSNVMSVSSSIVWQVCRFSSATIVYPANCSIGPLELSNIEGNILNLKIYPNPTVDKVQLSYELKQNSDLEISILDINGHEVDSHIESNLAVGRHISDLEVSFLSRGIYFVSLVSSQSKQIVKLVLY